MGGNRGADRSLSDGENSLKVMHAESLREVRLYTLYKLIDEGIIGFACDAFMPQAKVLPIVQ